MKTELWELYNFIKERSLLGEKTSVKDCCERFPSTFSLNAKESNFSNCPKLYQAIDEINESYEVEKFIIKDNNNFHIPTKEEADSYLDKELSKCLKALKKYWVMKKKAQADGQGKLVSCQDDWITDDSKARRYVEAFIDEIPD